MIPFTKTAQTLRLGALVLGIAALSACGGSSNNDDNTDGGSGGTPSSALSFAPVEAPDSDQEKRRILASATVTVDGRDYAIGYHTLLRSGDAVNENVVFGRLVDQTGAPLYGNDGQLAVADSNEHTSLLPINGRLFAVSQMETAPGAMFLLELDQDEQGLLTTRDVWQIDQSTVHGGWTHCAASVTPWNSHLASEEYEPDAAKSGSADDMLRYFGGDASAVNPYFWGWNIEVVVNATADAAPTTTLTKHYAMGRLAFELAKVMPDGKTVYMSDDGTNVGFYMFIADTAGDLSAGTLYAAKWMQTSGAGLGAADLQWLNLGHASDGEIAAYVNGADALTFTDIFQMGTATDGTCAAAFTPVMANGGTLECLAVKPGMEQAASRLEARRYAAMLGATLEFRKEEGLALDAASKTLYVSMSEVGNGMLDDAGYDLPGVNHIRVQGNKCGGVYQVALGSDSDIGSQYVARSMKGLIAGIPARYDAGSPYASYTCDKDALANPDNITFIDGYHTLVIGEDTGSGHQNDMVWALDLASMKEGDSKAGLTRIQTTPYGSESTGLYWYPDINGFAYLMSVVQHPYGESDQDKIPDGSLDHRAYTGYIGPFPAMSKQ